MARFMSFFSLLISSITLCGSNYDERFLNKKILAIVAFQSDSSGMKMICDLQFVRQLFMTRSIDEHRHIKEKKGMTFLTLPFLTL